MILAIDIGNSNIVLGVIGEGEPVFVDRLATDRGKTALEYTILLQNALALYGVDAQALTGAIVCSVVPEITEKLRGAARRLTGKEVMLVQNGLDFGMEIHMDNPENIGADLLADAVGAKEYPLPVIIFDLGTASTACALDAAGNYVGGVIYPGIMTALNAMTAQCSQLGGIALVAPERALGKNTIECMQGGVIFSNAAVLDGLIDRFEAELGQKATVVATGGLAHVITPHCRHEVILDDGLLLKGLRDIYRANVKRRK